MFFSFDVAFRVKFDSYNELLISDDDIDSLTADFAPTGNTVRGNPYPLGRFAEEAPEKSLGCLKDDTSVNHLLPYMREYLKEVEDMVTMGTERGKSCGMWIGKLADLSDELRSFGRNTKWMLDEFFSDLPDARMLTSEHIPCGMLS